MENDRPHPPCSECAPYEKCVVHPVLARERGCPLVSPDRSSLGSLLNRDITQTREAFEKVEQTEGDEAP